MKGKWWVAVVFGAMAVAFAGLAGTAQSSSERATKHTVKVGIVYSRTGLLSAYGAQYIQGLKLGLEYATKGTNRVNGHKIQITAVDDGTDPAKAVSAVKDLIGQGYKIIGGSTSTGVAAQVAAQADQNKVLNISGPAAGDLITGINKYTFRSGRQSYQDILTVKEIVGKSVGRRIVVLAQDSAFGQGNLAGVRAELGGRGHTVTSILVPLSATDFTPFAQRARDARPDLLFIAWAGTTGPALFRAIDQQRVAQNTKIATGLGERATWSSYPTGIDFLSHYVWNAPKSKVNDWLVKRMKRQGQVPDIFTPDGFVAAQMIVRAVQKGGGTDVDKMIAGLEGWKFIGPKGAQSIRAKDHAMIQPMFQVRLRTVGKRLVPRVVKRFSPGNLQPPVAS